MCAPCGKKDDHRMLMWETSQSGRLSQYTLAPIAKDSVSEPLACDEGDLASISLLENGHAHEAVIEAPSLREDSSELATRLDGLHPAASQRR